MGIKEKATYGEYYWAMQVEAQTKFAEDTEKEMSSMAARLMSSLHIYDDLPVEFNWLFAQLEEPAGAFLGDVGGRFVSEVADGAVSKAASPFFEAMGYAAYNRAPTKKMTPAAASILYSRKKIGEDFFLERFRMGGFEPIEAQFQYASMMPYPTIAEFVLYSRYHGDPEHPREMVMDFFDVPATEYLVWEWLTKQRLSTMDAHTMLRRGLIDHTDYDTILAQIGWDATDRSFQGKIGWTVPMAMLFVQGDLMQGKQTDQIIKDISIADIHPDYAQTYLDAVLTKPASTDIIAYELRRDPELSNLDPQLQKIGIHPEYTELYKTLAFPIPPVADIITMAVREAFTPAIAAKFGQYEGLPAEFTSWAEKKGISKEWSSRYWAAHWTLPSSLQGFEMLHRGIIDRTELEMLLKALDVMPFWRDKLVRMAYRRLTRVDIRRMYRTGVLNETEVYEAYLNHGYEDKNAKRMTEFTVEQALPKEAKITKGNILTAYKDRMIDRGEANSMLTAMGTESENISFMLTSIDYQRNLDIKTNRIKAVRNLYKRRVYNADKARAELLAIDMPDLEVSSLMEQWYYEIKAEPVRTWTTAQTLGFAKDKLITHDRALTELRLLGYDTEHINVYMESIV